MPEWASCSYNLKWLGSSAALLVTKQKRKAALLRFQTHAELQYFSRKFTAWVLKTKTRVPCSGFILNQSIKIKYIKLARSYAYRFDTALVYGALPQAVFLGFVSSEDEDGYLIFARFWFVSLLEKKPKDFLGVSALLFFGLSCR